MPAVSPNGRTIAFISDRSGQITIWTMNADGTQQKQLTFEGRDIRPRFSSDGTWLVYTSVLSRRRSALHRIAVGGGNPSPIPSSWTITPAVSPDGRFIAALDSERRLGVISAIDGSPVRSFDVQSVPSLRPTNESLAAPLDPTLNAELRWTNDSRAIAFVRQGVVYLQNLAGGPPDMIVDLSPDQIVSFDWTADGQSLLLARLSIQRGVVKLTNFR
jgi:dipeptidyl aminopeptidase/acylaminoacyl peptidase